MTKRNPDKREQKRLKKIEDEKQAKRYRVALLVKEGKSLREAGEAIGMSHEFAREWRDRLLDAHVSFKRIDGKRKKIVTYTFKKGVKGLLATKRPGPRPGTCPKV